MKVTTNNPHEFVLEYIGESLPEEMSDYLFKVNYGGIYQTEQPYDFRRKGLRQFLVMYTASGDGQLTYREKEYSLHKGDVFFIDCEHYHRYICAGREWIFSFIHLSYTEQGLFFYNKITNSGENVVFHYEEFQSEIWEKIQKELMARTVNYDVRISLIINTLFMRLMDSSAEEMPVSFSDAVSFIKKNYNQTFTLKQLADIAHFNKFYFLHAFKKVYGVTPFEYRKLYRNDMAKKLLMTTKQSVENIALETGYFSSTNFCKAFKEQNGLTPAKFRSQNAKTVLVKKSRKNANKTK